MQVASEGLRSLSDRMLAYFRVREILALLAGIFGAISVFVPWIYGFSPPAGPSQAVTLVASPNMLDLILHSNYGYMVAIPFGILAGFAFALTPQTTGRALKTILILTAFVLCLGGSFVFGLQFGSAYGLIMNGSYVSYNITFGPGSRLMELATTLYFFCLLMMVISE